MVRKKTSLNLHRTPPLRTTIPHNITIEINQTNEENYGWIQKTINYKSHVEDLKYICDHCQFHIESTVKQDLTKQTHFTKNETKNEHRQENGNNEIFNKETVTSHNYVEQVNISDIVLEPIIRETTLEQSNENSFNRDISQLHSGIVSDFDHDLSTSVSVKENTIKEKVQSNENHTEVISENEQSTKVDISSEKSNKHSAETLADYNAKTFESTTEEENGDLTTSKTSQTNNEVQENEELNTEKEGKGTSLNKEVENVTDKKISETTEFRKTSNTHKTTEVNFERYNEPEKSEKISTNAQKSDFSATNIEENSSFIHTVSSRPSTKGTITLKNEEYQVTTNTMKKTELEKNEDTGKGSQGVLLTEAENEERTTSRIVTKPKVNNIFQNNTMTEGNTEEEMSITNSGFLETERSSIKSKVEHKTSKTSTQNEISESYKIEKGNLEKNTKSKYEKSSFSQIFLTEISKHKIATEVPDEYFTITEESLSATVSTNNIIEKPKHEETTVKHEMSLTKSEFLQTKISSFESKFEHKTSESSTENKLIERYQTEEGNLEKSTMEPRVERKTSEGSTENESSESYKTEVANLEKSTMESKLEYKTSESSTENELNENYQTEEGNLEKSTMEPRLEYKTSESSTENELNENYQTEEGNLEKSTMEPRLEHKTSKSTTENELNESYQAEEENLEKSTMESKLEYKTSENNTENELNESYKTEEGNLEKSTMGPRLERKTSEGSTENESSESYKTEEGNLENSTMEPRLERKTSEGSTENESNESYKTEVGNLEKSTMESKLEYKTSESSTENELNENYQTEEGNLEKGTMEPRLEHKTSKNTTENELNESYQAEEGSLEKSTMEPRLGHKTSEGSTENESSKSYKIEEGSLEKSTMEPRLGHKTSEGSTENESSESYKIEEGNLEKSTMESRLEHKTSESSTENESSESYKTEEGNLEKSTVEARLEHKISESTTKNESSESYKTEEGNLGKTTKARYEKSSITYIFLTEESKNRITTEETDEYFTITEKNLPANTATNNIIEKPEHKKITVIHETSSKMFTTESEESDKDNSKKGSSKQKNAENIEEHSTMAQAKYEFSTNEMNTLSEQQKGSDYRYSSFEEMEKDAIEYKTDARENQEFGHSETLPPNTASTVHEKGETIFVSNKPTKNTNIKSSFYTSTYHVDATYGHKNTLFPKTTVNKEILHDYDKYLCNPCPTKSKNYAAQGSVALKNKPHEMEPESSQYFTHIASSSKNLNIKENDDVNLQPDVLETIIRKVQPTKNIESLSQSSTPKNAETPEIDQELPAVSTFTTKISVFTRNDEDLYLQPEIENEARQHTHPNKMFSSTNKCPLSKNEKESEDEYEYVSIASDIEEQTQEGPILLNNKQGSTILSQYLTRLNEENIHEVIEGSHFKFTSTLPTEGTSFLKESGKKVTKYRNGATRKYWNTKNLLETASEEVAPTVIHYVYINCTKSEDAPLKSPGLFAKNGKNQHADSVNMEKNIHHQSIHNDGEQITEHNKEKETFTHETKKNKYKKPSSDISITDIETEIDSFESSNSLSEKTNTPAEIIGFSTVEEANENEIKYESTVEERHTIDISLNQSHKEDQYTKNSETIIHTLTEVENITQKNGSTSNLENEEMNENESENIEEENGTYDTETGVMNVTEPSIHLSDTENLNVEENNKTIAETAIYTKDIENVSENVEITERNEHESKNVEEEEDSNVETDSEMTDSVEISSFHHTKIQNLNHTVKEETLSNKPEIESNSKMEKSEANTTEQKNGNIEQEGTISEYIELKSMNLMESTSFDHSKTSHKNKENNEERSHHSTEEMINTQEIENESVTEEQASTNKKKSKNAEPANSLNKISDNQKTEMPIEEQYQTTKEEVERSPHSRIQEEEMTSEYSKEENEISERNVLIPESNTNQKVDFSYTLTARTKIEISEEKTSEPFDYSLSEPARVLIEEIESEKKLETKSGESELEFETQSELTDLFSIFEYATFQTTASNFHKNTFTSPHAEHHQHRLHSKKLITPPSTIEIEPPLEFVDSTICKLCNKSKKHHTTEHMKYTTIVQPKTNNQEEQEEINEITLENMKDTEEGNTTVELEHEEEQEGTESNGENEEEISHEAMKTKKQKQKNEKTTIKTHVTQHQTSTAKETEHTTYMTTTEKSTTKESTKTISTQEAITESVKNTNIEHTESAEKYEEESTSQAEKLAISTKHSKNPKKFSYTHGAVITTTEMISHGVIQKPNVFVIKVSKENEKLSDNIIENIVNSPMTDIIVHYIDLSSNKDKKLPSNPRENVSLGLDIPHQKCKKSEFESGENCFCNINEYIETLINKINKKEEVKAKDNYCETFFKLSKGLVIGLSTGSTKRKRRGLLYMKNEGVGENVHYDSIEGIFESYFHLFSKGSHSYHLPGESAIIHCNNGMFNPQSKSDSTWIWMFHPPNAIKDTLLQEKSEVLTLHDVTSKNVGNYTCSPENSEKKNWHKLEIVTFPTYEVQINIFYTINDSCSLQTGDILYMKLSKIVAPILCSKTNDFCNFDMDRPRCLTREDNNFYNVSMRIKTNQDFILSIKTECDINCKLSIYENVAGIIYKNCDNLQHVPIHLEVEKSYEIDFIPHIDGKQKSAIIVSSPKIAVSCLSGYGLEIKRQRICVLCPSQTFSGENEAFCIRCPAGKYQPEPGSKECIQCNSPVDDKACLRMLYTDTRLFKVYVGVAFGMIVLLIIVVVVWMTGLHDYSQNSINDRYEGSLRHRADLKTKQKDLEKGIRQPLLSKSPREAPPQLPPVDF